MSSANHSVQINIGAKVDNLVHEVGLARKSLQALHMQMEMTARSTAKIQKSTAIGLKGVFGSMTSFAASARGALLSLNGVLITLPKSMLDTAGKFERLEKLMEGVSKKLTMEDKVKDAKENMEKIINLSRNAPFAVEAIADSFVKFESAGIKNAHENLQTLIDSVANFGGTSDTLKRASVAIQQMGGKGVISMEELRQQLGEAVPDAMKKMSIGMNMTMGELVDIISKGQVEAHSAMSKMFAVMYLDNIGSAQRMMETWEGVKSRLKTSWELFQKSIADSGLMEFASGELKKLTDFFNSFEGTSFAQEIGTIVKTVVSGLSKAIKFVYEFRKQIILLGASFFATKTLKSVNSLFGGFFSSSMSAKFLEAIRDYKAKLMGLTEAEKQEAEKMRHFRQLSFEKRIQYLKQQIVDEAHLRGQDLANQIAVHEQSLAQERSHLAKQLSLQRNYAKQYAIAVQSKSIVDINRTKQQLDTQKAITDQLKLSTSAQADYIKSLNQQKDALMKTTRETVELKKAVYAKQAAFAAGRSIFNAVGGWLGVISAALSLGAYLWSVWGDNGESAIERVKAAINNGTYDREAHEKEGKRIYGNKDSRIADARGEIYGQGSGRNESTDAAKEEKKLIEFNKRKAEIEKEFEPIIQAWKDNEAKAIANETAKNVSSYQGALNNLLNKNSLDVGTEEAKKISELAKSNLSASAKAEAESKIAHQSRVDLANRNIESLRNERAALEKAMVGMNETDESIQKTKIGEVDRRIAENQRALFALESQNVFMQGNNKNGGGGFDKNARKIEKSLERLGEISREVEQRGASLQDRLLNPKAIDITTLGVYKLNQELLDLRAKLGNNVKELESFDAAARKLMQNEAINDLSELALDLREKTKSINDNLITDHKERANLEYQREVELVMEKYNLLMQQVENHEDAAEQIKAINDDLNAWLIAKDKERIEATKSEISKLTDAWIRDYKPKMEQATRDLANETMNQFVNMANGGKFEWRKMLSDWLLNLARANFERALAKPFEKFFNWLNDSIADTLDKLVNGFGNTASQVGSQVITGTSPVGGGALNYATQAPMGMFGGMSQPMGGMVNNGMMGGFNPCSCLGMMGGGGMGGLGMQYGQAIPLNGLMGGQEGGGLLDSILKPIKDVFNQLGDIVSDVIDGFLNLFDISEVTKTGFEDLSFTGISEMTTSSIENVTQGAINTAKQTTQSDLLVTAEQGLTNQMVSSMIQLQAASAGGGFKFADGGIMSSKGSLPLKKYARGGIAKSPQLALFGEGSMNEAYVPLPDGRSIPVTMTGGGQGGTLVNQPVTIAITINKEGSETSTSDGDEASQWKNVAEKVRNVVTQELSVQTRNGGIIDNAIRRRTS